MMAVECKKFCFWDSGSYDSYEDALESGAVYEMSSDFSYDDYTGVMDTVEAIQAALDCVGGCVERIVICAFNKNTGKVVDVAPYIANGKNPFNSI
jgi:hypothetical protein